jgi:hypothetical protein
MFCPRCGLRQPQDHRYCLSCGAELPSHLLSGGGPKESRWFLALPVVPQDRAGTAIRVSRYLEAFDWSTDEGTVRVPAQHVRFSIWISDEVQAAASMSASDAQALADFLLTAEHSAPDPEGDDQPSGSGEARLVT